VIGATPGPDGTRFDLWAPERQRVEVVADDGRSWPLARDGDGHHRAVVTGVGAGDRYRYRLDGGELLPDPASRFQPDGVHGPSVVVDPSSWTWTDDDWTGPEPDGQVLYECHIGTFTPAGTFDAAVTHLPRLADLGVTTIEIMPVAQFSGTRNWGYDGVFPWSVQNSYGGPDGLARLVDAAHGHGLAVLLDVVYNHFGPEGNVLPHFGPYLTDLHHTPWGEAVNIDDRGSDEVRSYFINSARAFVRDHHIDGFRLDAVHAIHDHTAHPFLEQWAAATRAEAAGLGRRVLLTAESDDNDPRLIRSRRRHGLGFDATWNDDVHHALRVALTGEQVEYYADYSGVADLERAMTDRYVMADRYSQRRGRHHGRPAPEEPFQRFVVFSTNHDHIGNRPAGDRLDAVVDDHRRALAAAFVLLSPFTPLLFQGEEYGETAPFPYFVDHRSPELIQAVRYGRRLEFADHHWRGELPDPAAETTFASAVLRPDVDDSRSRRFRRLYADLLALRRTHPILWRPEADQVTTRDGDTLVVARRLGDHQVSCVFRFADTPTRVTLDDGGPWRLVFDSRGAEPTSGATETLDTGRVEVDGWQAIALSRA
jgi:maltooligosyltrehalose trehalohydrolase